MPPPLTPPPPAAPRRAVVVREWKRCCMTTTEWTLDGRHQSRFIIRLNDKVVGQGRAG